MGLSSRLHQPSWLSGAIHFVIIGVAFQSESAEAWPYALLAMSVVSFPCWVANYRRYRRIHDVPTAKIASAAQGYTELFGRAELPGGEVLRSPLSSTPCCWFSYQVEEKNSDNKWSTVDSGTSNAHFLLIDDTGQCVVSPEGAEVLTNENKSWEEGDRRYNEWLLMPRGVLYALGEFSTRTAAAVVASDQRAEVGALLAEWKQNQKSLLDRFDLNHDGKIDLKEWELARLQAQREIRNRQSALQSTASEGTHILGAPKDGRLFLLANEVPDELGSRYKLRSWMHLAIFIGAGSAGLILL
jgi:hypothetical protein